MFDIKFIEIVKKIADKEFVELDVVAKCNESPIKCEDQFAAIVEITQNKVDYIKNDLTNKNRAKEQKKYQQYNIPTIALILESPHTSEFNLEKGVCYGPAIGKTGEHIEKFLLGNIAKYICINDLKNNGAYFLKNSKIQAGKYRIFLINSIQYQCSLGTLREKKDIDNRDKIFIDMFNNSDVKENFIDRLNLHSPRIIINCCTKGEKNLQEIVQKEIDINFPKAIKLIGNHPSSAYFCHGFQDA